MSKSPWTILASVGVVALVACSTPESRIQKNLDLFNSYPLNTQAKIRAGQIDVGFTAEMVNMALGEPRRIYNRKTASGNSEVWAYVGYRYTTERQRAYVDAPVYDFNGTRRTHREWVDVDVQKTEEYDKLRVEFNEGVVSAIESVDQ